MPCVFCHTHCPILVTCLKWGNTGHFYNHMPISNPQLMVLLSKGKVIQSLPNIVIALLGYFMPSTCLVLFRFGRGIGVEAMLVLESSVGLRQCWQSWHCVVEKSKASVHFQGFTITYFMFHVTHDNVSSTPPCFALFSLFPRVTRVILRIIWDQNTQQSHKISEHTFVGWVLLGKGSLCLCEGYQLCVRPLGGMEGGGATHKCPIVENPHTALGGIRFHKTQRSHEAKLQTLFLFSLHAKQLLQYVDVYMLLIRQINRSWYPMEN